VSIKVVGRVVSIKWHQAWRVGGGKKGRVKRIDKDEYNSSELHTLAEEKKTRMSGPRPTYL
jgi:hypothetical protein